MSRTVIKAALWGLVVAAFLRYGLEPTGWLFYEASFALNIDWLYWGYTVFRGGGYLFGLWPFQAIACAAAGLLVGLLVLWRSKRKETP